MRIEKVAILEEVVARITDSDYCFIINHGGVTVAQFAALRKDLRALDSRLLVVKNTFLAKVAKEKGWSEEVNAMLVGGSAVVTGHGEPTAVAKAIMEFVKNSGGKASVKGADYDGKIVDASVVDALSKIPGKDQLRATLLMLLKEPATRIARVLSEKAKKEPAAEAPAAEAPAAEEAPAEAPAAEAPAAEAPAAEAPAEA